MQRVKREPIIPNRVSPSVGIDEAPSKYGNRVHSGRSMRKGKQWRTNAVETKPRPIPVIKF